MVLLLVPFLYSLGLAPFHLEKEDKYPRIRALREDKDMTQTDLANVLHCSQRVYSNYEQGDVDIPTAVLIKLAEFHNVSIDYLLGCTENPERNK